MSNEFFIPLIIFILFVVRFYLKKLKLNSTVRWVVLVIIFMLLWGGIQYKTRSIGKYSGVVTNIECVTYNRSYVGPKVDLKNSSSRATFTFSFPFRAINGMCEERLNEISIGDHVDVYYIGGALSNSALTLLVNGEQLIKTRNYIETCKSDYWNKLLDCSKGKKKLNVPK